jgi:hypothetical protein
MRKLHFATRNLAILAVLAMTFSAGYGASIPKHDHALFFTGSTPPDTAIYCGVKATTMPVPYTLHVSATAIGSGGTFQIIRKNGTPISTPSVNAGTTYSISYQLDGVFNVDDVVKITPGTNVQSMMVSVAAGGAAEDYFNESPAQLDNFCVTAPNEPGSIPEPMFPSPPGRASFAQAAQPPVLTDPTSTQSLNEFIYCGAVRKVWQWYRAEVFGVKFYVWWFRRVPYPYTLSVTATTRGSPGTFRITFRDGDSMGFEVPAGTTSTTTPYTTHALGGVPGVDDVVKITAEGGITSLTAGVKVPPQSGFYVWPYDPFPHDPFDETPARSNNFCVRAGEPGLSSPEGYFPGP